MEFQAVLNVKGECESSNGPLEMSFTLKPGQKSLFLFQRLPLIDITTINIQSHPVIYQSYLDFNSSQQIDNFKFSRI